MRVKKQESIVFEICLSEDEAAKLKAMVQNPLGEDEPEDWEKFRSLVWNTLESAGVK